MRKALHTVFILCFVVLATAGCAREQTADYDPSGTIRLDATTTRASVSNVLDLQSGFRVFATAGDIASTQQWYPGMDGTNNHIYSGGHWGFQTPVQWPTDPAKYPMTFYAFYPASPQGLSLTQDPSTTPPTLTADITIGATPAEQVDILAAKAIAATRPSGDNLSMTFDHILSKVDFGIIPGRGMTPEIIALGMWQVGDTRRYDLVAGQWTAQQPSTQAAIYDYYGTIFYEILHNGVSIPENVFPWSPGAGDDETTSVPFFNAATTPLAADAHLMLMPQTSPAWKPGNLADQFAGAFVAVMYRMTGNGGIDEVGFASARNHPDFATLGSGYEGPLYVLAVFPLPADTNGNFTWEPGKGYIYNIGLGTSGSSNGYVGNGFYFDSGGNITSLPIINDRQVGEPLNDGVIHIDLDITGWDGENGGELVDAKPNFVDPQVPYIIYWDEATQTMQVGSWNAVTGGAVKTENQLFFQFGGTVGFMNEDNAWGASRIKFNVTSLTDYVSLPNWYNYTGDKTSTADGYISTEAYHNVANVTAGRGDPCRLIGLTIEQVRAGVIDNGRFRMPTVAEYGSAAEWTITGSLPASNTFNTTYGITRTDGTFLPASGSRNANGAASATGRTGFYWMSRSYTSVNGYAISWTSSLNVARSLDGRFGIPVRCIGQTLYPVSASAGSGGTAKVTNDKAGANAITESPEGGSVIFTAAVDPLSGVAFSGWTATGITLTDEQRFSNPLSFSMPGNEISLTANFIVPVEVFGTIWAASNVAASGTFAFNVFDYDVANQYDWSSVQTNNFTGVCPAGWRTPTDTEYTNLRDNSTSYSWKANVYRQGFNGMEVVAPNGTLFFSASGVHNNGVNVNESLLGYYRTSTKPTGGANGTAAIMRFSETELFVMIGAVDGYTYSVRCVRSAPGYPVSAIADAGGTAKVTSDSAGTLPITESPAGVPVTFTATATQGYEFAGWTATGITLDATQATTSPLTIVMPRNGITLTATFRVGFVDVRVGDVLWSLANVASSGTFASTPLMYDGANQYTFAQVTANGNRGVCPAGWRTPTNDEMQSLVDNSTSTYITNYKGSGITGMEFVTPNGVIFLSASGHSQGSTQGTNGYYRTSTPDHSNTLNSRIMIFFGGSTPILSNADETYRYSVRCVKDAGVGNDITFGGVTWAGKNVASSGTFASTPLMYDGANQYTFDQVTANGNQGVCPAGWRTPSDAEIWGLIENSTSHTYYDNYNGTGINGLEVVTPNGTLFFAASGYAQGMGSGTGGYYRTSTIDDDGQGINSMVMVTSQTETKMNGAFNGALYSVRCVK